MMVPNPTLLVDMHHLEPYELTREEINACLLFYLIKSTTAHLSTQSFSNGSYIQNESHDAACKKDMIISPSYETGWRYRR